ncbi:hypothetical protein BELL_0905g00040 [Botrytis elliptica]|uniref:Uncharacterized protein n=1 Tax=Botrytis elliptica TaxID=278938 RepID=A0A4Z1JDF5_9HELO|nr:hypothetical protein EAE99_011778 [Botrytis elliptica]TGO67243.1 hypothetical protein BELL_0905g00040 [Botrytis elliptica]
MSDPSSHYRSEGDPFDHQAYGATVISAGVGMGMLRSGIPAGDEPVPRVLRSLYDKIHCEASNESTERSDRHWKEEHIHDNIECRRAYFERTCTYERDAFATRPDPIYRPEGYVTPTQISQLQYSNPQLQIQQTRAYSSNSPVTQSETQSAQAYFISHSPQTPQEEEHSDQGLSPNAFQTTHPSEWLHSDQRLSPNAYQINYPSTWLNSPNHPSQPDQGYAQHPTEVHDDPYTDDASHNSSPAYDSEAQRAPAANFGASQGREYTTTTRNSDSGRRGHRRTGSS